MSLLLVMIAMIHTDLPILHRQSIFHQNTLSLDMPTHLTAFHILAPMDTGTTNFNTRVIMDTAILDIDIQDTTATEIIDRCINRMLTRGPS